MKFILISSHRRSVIVDSKVNSIVLGLYKVIDEETEATPYMVSRDPDSERTWISRETAIEMLHEDDAVMASNVPAKIVVDLLGDAK
ncbi:MAG: hypothetical protein V3S76_00530 [Candidatus Bipolaricaulota bacterium]